MTILRIYRRLIALPTTVMMMCMVLPYGAVKAEMVSTELLLAAPPSLSSSAPDVRAELIGFLERADVQAEMRALGVDPAEAAARVQVMSDREIEQLAGKLQDSPAGGSVVGIVVGSVVFVFLVLLLTDILCLTSIFPFTKCINNASK